MVTEKQSKSVKINTKTGMMAMIMITIIIIFDELPKRIKSQDRIFQLMIPEKHLTENM